VYSGKMLDSAVEFRGTVGSSIVCRMPVLGGTQIVVPPKDSLSAGNVVSVWRTTPAVGDSVWIFDEGLLPGRSDDVWLVRGVTAVTAVANGCTNVIYTSAGDAAKTAYTLTLGAAISSTVTEGAPVRFFRRVHYSLYQASDNRWYLGYYDCHASNVPTCTTIQPVSGPYREYSSNAGAGVSGLAFHYYDVNGNVTANRLSVARIELAVRSRTEAYVAPGGGALQRYTDTARVVIGIRNRS
jgi:hypothetical protein